MPRETYEIESAGTDKTGEYIALEDCAPLDGLTVDKADGTVTLHNESESEIKQTLRHLLSIERDRLLGYQEFHMSPQSAVQEAVDALRHRGENIDELVLPEDQQKLDIE